MDFVRFLELVLLSGGIGLGAYCVACAFHVWWSRNASAGGRRWRKRLRVGGVLLAIAGMSIAFAGLLSQLFLNREGVLHGEQLVTIRAAPDLLVDKLTTADTVARGEQLVRFASPELQAQRKVLQLTQERLQAEKRMLQKTPLNPAPETTRQLQEAAAQLRHLQTAIHDLHLERERVRREQARDYLARKGELNQLQQKIDSLESELKQAEAEDTYQTRRTERLRSLQERQAATKEVYEQTESEARIAEQEVLRLQQAIKNYRAEQANLQENLKTLVSLTEQQAADFQKGLDDRQNQLAAVRDRHEQFEQQLEEDVERAEQQRQERLKQLDVELRQTQEELTGTTERLERKADMAGRVVYRAPSPKTVGPDEPLLVIAPPDGIRVRFRLPAWEARLLEGVENVPLKLLEAEDAEGRILRHFLVQRFAARLMHQKLLPHDDGYAVAELSCTPPEEALEQLASGEEVSTRLLWWAPLYHNPWFQAGGLLAGVGLVFAVSSGWFRRADDQAIALSHARDSAADPVQHEVGSEGAMLYLLGSQLRESLASGELDAHLLAATEWALERHRARAVRLLAMGFDEEADVAEQLTMLSRACQGDDAANEWEADRHRGERLHRFLLILETIGSEELGEHIRRLQRKATRHRSTDRQLQAATEFEGAS